MPNSSESSNNKTPAPNACPCGSGKLFTHCCQPFIHYQQLPATPEQLMRSRYSAFCTQEFEYILQTCVDQPDKAELESEAETLKQDYQGIVWLKLNILESGDGVNGEKSGNGEKVTEGKVHFQAIYGIKGKVYALEENSTFQRISTELSRSKASGLITRFKSNQDKNSQDKSSQNNNADSGQWLYHANQSQSTMQRVKLSRNDECICGSGNKFKKCCERLIR